MTGCFIVNRAGWVAWWLKHLGLGSIPHIGTMYEDMLEADTERFLQRCVMMAETWIHHCQPNNNPLVLDHNSFLKCVHFTKCNATCLAFNIPH